MTQITKTFLQMTPPKQNWEKEFEETFTILKSGQIVVKEDFEIDKNKGLKIIHPKNNLEKVKSFIRSLKESHEHETCIGREKVEKAIDEMEKREFVHTFATGDIEHLSFPDICGGCQAQMNFLEVLSVFRRELLSKKEK